MSDATNNHIKKSRGRPPVDSQQFNLRLHRDEIEAIAKLEETLPRKPSKMQTVRYILRDWLTSHGLLNADP